MHLSFHPIDWRIVQFDDDKTISIEELEKEYPRINWHSKAGLTLRSVGAAFRMYVKEMPEQGPCLRVEFNNSFKDSKTLSEKIKEMMQNIHQKILLEKDYLKEMTTIKMKIMKTNQNKINL